MTCHVRSDAVLVVLILQIELRCTHWWVPELNTVHRRRKHTRIVGGWGGGGGHSNARVCEAHVMLKIYMYI